MGKQIVVNGIAIRSDLRNKRFGRLLVIKPVCKTGYGATKWECICDCGNVKNIVGSNVSKGITRSCGCLARELSSKRLQKPFGEASLNFLYYGSRS